MNTKACISRLHTPNVLIAAAFILVAFFSSQYSLAQVAPVARNSDDETVVLDKFVVNTDKDRGYVANSTLGGTRTNTALKDLANPLDIFTPELMQDLAVQDIQDLAAFANGVEANEGGDHNGDGQEREVWNYNYMQIRGFKVGTLTRNFMALNAQFEAYNSERVEFSKGPNAILSGIGDPGGSVNYGTKTPKLHRSSYSVSYRTDDLGSQRATMDINQVLIKNKLGLRLNALYEDEEFYRHPAYEKQNAWHLTAQYRPTRKTTIDVGYERRRSDRASPRGVFATDYVTNWVNAGEPIITTKIPSSGNNIMVNGGTTAVTAASQGMAIYGTTWIVDSDGMAKNATRTAHGTPARANGKDMDTVATGFAYPLDTVLGGPNGINDSDWDISEVRITQMFTNNFQMELAYGHTENRVRQGNSVSRTLDIDTNGWDDLSHGGDLFVQTQPFWIDRQFNINHFRGSLSYELDLRKWSKWAGKHQLAAVAEHNDNKEWSNTGRFVIKSGPGFTMPSNGYQNSSTYFYLREYLDPARGKWTMRDLRDIYYSDGLIAGDYEAIYAARDSYAFYNKRTKRDTALGVLQSRWLNDRVITTVGIRKDRESLYRASTYLDTATGIYRPGKSDIGKSHPKFAPYIDDPTVNSGYSRNYGVVIHVTDWLSLTGNYSNNMSLSAESTDIHGNFLPPATGNSKDFGVRFNLLDNHLNVTLVKYITKQEGYVTPQGNVNAPITAMDNIEKVLADNDIPGFSIDNIKGAHTTSDREAKGEELTIVGNVTQNWTLRLSASRSSNVMSNIAPDVREYYLSHMPLYESYSPALVDNNGYTLGDRIATAKNSWAMMNAREGTENWPSSKYNIRLTTKYSFSRSFLKGFSIGGNVRWASAPTIGYYLVNTTNSDSLYADRPEMNGAYDTNRAAKGKDEYFLDMFLTYERKIWRNILWKVQLNISNLLDETDPYATAAINNRDGRDFQWITYRYRPINGRVLILSTSLSF